MRHSPPFRISLIGEVIPGQEPHGISHVTPYIFLRVLSLRHRGSDEVLARTTSGKIGGVLEPLALLLRLSLAVMTSPLIIPVFAKVIQARPSQLPCPVMGTGDDAPCGFTLVKARGFASTSLRGLCRFVPEQEIAPLPVSLAIQAIM